MTDSLLGSVVHPTDFSPAGLDAFAHALRLAVAAKSHFYILHIECETEQADWVQFPRVRETLAAWGMIAPDAPRSAVASELGLRVEKAIIGSDDPVRGVEAFVEQHQCDLLVLMTHARSVPPRSFSRERSTGCAPLARPRKQKRHVQVSLGSKPWHWVVGQFEFQQWGG